MCLPIFAGIGVAMGASASSAAAAGTATVMSVIATVASTAMSVESAMSQSAQMKKQAAYEKQSAINAENVGAQKGADELLKARRITAAGIAASGAGGVDPSTGTPLTLGAQTMQFGELNNLRVINNAQNTAWGYNTQAALETDQANQTMWGGIAKGGATLLGGASQAYFGPGGGGGSGQYSNPFSDYSPAY